MIGQRLGHYRIVEKIGKGDTFEVYRSHDEQLDRDVALKVLRRGTLRDEPARKEFREEILTLAKLNHPNIETVFEFGTQDREDYLAMELIPGTTLSEKLKPGPLPEHDLVRLGTQFAQGLIAAHEQGVVHSDLKPGHIMVTPDGRLKILDFGLARLFRLVRADDARHCVPEASGTFAGTLPYLSPEQLRSEHADARSDIYAAGAVLYEASTGRRPFPQTHGPTLLGAILHQKPEPPSSVNRQLTLGIETLILKALEKERHARYQSAAEFRAALETLGATSS
jgi:eukaryotic-like serine/threonine-protein kinase